MQCPTDGTVLVMSERSGIEIDYCPDCRGVWLDRGELDKILDRATTSNPEPARESPSYERQSRESARPTQQPYRKKKKEHWLTELFE
ncbi:MAG: zf-TFIIB domain-containing protein [Actinomycetota bacterium]|nr:zf-TFIIB domain-containing protein [Actinomycetota bacterium]